MRASVFRLAESITSKPLSLREATATLLPPIPLYRRILRKHRSLPIAMRSLGDSYIKTEFRLHRAVSNPVYVMGFLTQWKMYLDEISQHSPETYTGRRLDPTVFEKMSPEQLSQLYDLMHAAKDVWKSAEPEPEAEPPLQAKVSMA